jgi:hypothetical protein
MESRKDDARLRLLERAAANEGLYESLIMKLAAERRLNSQDLENLANFREGLQCLRESIGKKTVLTARDGDGKEWMSQTRDERPFRAKAYRSFKVLAVFVSTLIKQREFRRGREVEAAVALLEATSTSTERRGNWWKQGLDQPSTALSEKTTRASSPLAAKSPNRPENTSS